ncbi:methionine aminotransferase [Janthinobacterium fluminis]|uniref:Methionine aminotransferase n=1 Tax=Janthinobacterium fluminis TaxID=2987524 RepID=A0ABT5K0L8_9BURK|nr:methionine aminotransferase [Janthinobacterium fluminis]MDC8757302.1 methionine aminotransferase [Janthinobacterium fluminis]
MRSSDECVPAPGALINASNGSDAAVNIFSRMSRLATKHGAINLAQGFPDFACDGALIECAAAALRGENNQYAPVAGLPSLRAAIAEKILSEMDVHVDPDQEITVTAGAAQAIFTAIGCMLCPGDEVLILEPAYDSYIPAILAKGGVPRIVTLKAPDFRINWDEVEHAVTPRTRVLIINSPNNPSGRVLNLTEINALALIAEKHDLLIISDEVYEHIVFDGKQHHSFLQHAKLRSRSFVVFSFGKTLHVTGWKIGYCVAPPAYTRKLQALHQYAIFSVNAPLQAGIAAYLGCHRGAWSLSDLFLPKRDRLRAGLVENGFTLCETQGTYFQLAEFSNVRNDLTDFEFADWLTISGGVACIPLSSFYSGMDNGKYVRFCFAKKDETIDIALSRLRRL